MEKQGVGEGHELTFPGHILEDGVGHVRGGRKANPSPRRKCQKNSKPVDRGGGKNSGRKLFKTEGRNA